MISSPLEVYRKFVADTMRPLSLGVNKQCGGPFQQLSKEGAERLGNLSPVNFLPWLRFLPSFRRDFQFIKSVLESARAVL